MSVREMGSRSRAIIAALVVLLVCFGGIAYLVRDQSFQVDLSETTGLDATCTVPEAAYGNGWDNGVDAIVFVNQDTTSQVFEQRDGEYVGISQPKGNAAAIRSELETAPSVASVIEVDREAIDREIGSSSISIDDLPTVLQVIASDAEADLPFRTLMQVIETQPGVEVSELVDLCLPDYLGQILQCQTTSGDDLMVLLDTDNHPFLAGVQDVIDAQPSVESVRFVDGVASLIEVSELLDISLETGLLNSDDVPASFRIVTSDPGETARGLREAEAADFGINAMIQTIAVPGTCP